MLKIKSINKIIATSFVVAVYTLLPNVTFAGPGGTYGSGGWDDTYSTGWGGSTPSYEYDYTPTYYDTYSTGWGGSTPSYDYDYTPTYYDTSYGSDWGGSSSAYYPSMSYTGSVVPGASIYTGGTSRPSYYSSGSTPSTSNSNSTSNATNKTTVTSNNTNANSAVASSTNINNNVNNNNVFVYTNPQGTAVLYNPAFQHLDGYCTVTPNNPKTGQTVTATAYATGGIGSYTYTWGGDLIYGSGASTQFTSYNVGTKNITVTVRSGEEVITRNCTVNFVSENTNNGTLSASCYATPQNADINQIVSWRVSPSGGNGSYTYSWSGSDNLSGVNSVIDRSYNTAGQKYATVQVYSNGQTVTASCNANIGSNYVASNVSVSRVTSGTPVSGVFVQPGTPVSGVYLNQLPATGIDLNWIHYTVGLMIAVLGIMALVISQSKKRFLATRE